MRCYDHTSRSMSWARRRQWTETEALPAISGNALRLLAPEAEDDSLRRRLRQLRAANWATCSLNGSRLTDGAISAHSRKRAAAGLARMECMVRCTGSRARGVAGEVPHGQGSISAALQRSAHPATTELARSFGRAHPAYVRRVCMANGRVAWASVASVVRCQARRTFATTAARCVRSPNAH